LETDWLTAVLPADTIETGSATLRAALTALVSDTPRQPRQHDGAII
jgi:hypothetical protein